MAGDGVDKGLGVDAVRHGYVCERIEKLHLDAKRIGEERIDLRQEGGAARYVELCGRAAVLLAAVEVDGTRNLGVQPREDGAADLRDAVEHLVVVLRHAAHRDVGALALDLLGEVCNLPVEVFL